MTGEVLDWQLQLQTEVAARRCRPKLQTEGAAQSCSPGLVPEPATESGRWDLRSVTLTFMSEIRYLLGKNERNFAHKRERVFG